MPHKQTSSVDLLRVAQLFYPVIITQMADEISEAKAAELLGMNIETYRETKAGIVAAIMGMIEALPSPLILLLERKDKN